ALRRADAERCAREALALAREHSERGHEAYAFRLLGELGSSDSADIDDSETFFRQGIARSEDLGMSPLTAKCHFGLGRRFRRIARRDDARSHLNAAVELFATLDMPFWLERARAELAALG